MPSEHPKVTTYLPQPILDALNVWKTQNGIESRSGAVVAILADYLGVQYPVQQESTEKTAPHGVLSTVLAEFATLSERVALLEKQMVVSAVHNTVPSNLPGKPPRRTGEAPREAPHTAQKKDTPRARTAPSSVLPTPLTQSALAKRLGCSDKAVEKHRRQGNMENFAAWSHERDPDGIAWTWHGTGGRGQPLRFVPQT